MDIRNAIAEDAERIYEMNKHELGYEYPQENTRKQLERLLHSKQDIIFVASSDNNVIGYVHGSSYDTTYSNALKNVMAMAVDKEWQGKGVGKLLLEALETRAKEDGCAGLRLSSGLSRQGAHAFYKSCGYSMRNTAKNFIKLF